MPWLRVRTDAVREDAEAIGERLRESGAFAISLKPRNEDDDSVLEPPPALHPMLWPTVRVEALLPVDTDLSALSPLDCDVDFLADADWDEAWRADFAEMRFGRLRVVPTAHSDACGNAPVPNEATVRLDPGLAFGTGAHPSTALCLRWLAEQDLAGKRVLDFGAGSGILAIAALRLGARQAVAVDHDPQARRACASNARANGVRLHVVRDLNAATGAFDIAVANIVADVLCDMAAALCACASKLALSGILVRQMERVMRAYPRIRFQPPLAEDGWGLLSGDRRG